MDKPTEAMIHRLEMILSRYDPDFDILPAGPAVTWAEHELADYLISVAKYVSTLETRIAVLEADRAKMAQKKRAAETMAESLEREYEETGHPEAKRDAQIWRARADSIILEEA